MSHVVYRGNAAFEETEHGTVVRVGYRQATIPRSVVTTDALREAALSLTVPRPTEGLARTPAMRVLERLGAIAQTSLKYADATGWPYVLKHADDPDRAMAMLHDWQLDVRGASKDVAATSAIWRMFTKNDGARRCRVLYLGDDVHAASDAETWLLVDPYFAPERPAKIVLTDDPSTVLRQWKVHDGDKHSAHATLAEAGTPMRKLLLALGVALLVDRAAGINRLHNSYRVTHDLNVTNVIVGGYSESAPRADTPAREPRGNAQIIDRILVLGAIDARLAGRILFEVSDGIPTATCIWMLVGRQQSVTATGGDTSEAGVRAIARAVARSLRIIGWRDFTVQVGTASVSRGKAPDYHVASSFLGIDDIRIGLADSAQESTDRA